jgi:tetratricopeptide (TPR) repeat protein
MDFRSFGLQPVWYHLVNVVLHALTCLYFYLLVFVLARRRSKEEGIRQLVYDIPLIAAGLLACHPLAAESVSYVTGRAGTLVASNFFLSLLFFLFGFWSQTLKRKLLGYVLSFACFAMGVWSGLEAVAIPAAALALILLLRPISITFKGWSAEKWPEITIVALLTVASCLLPALGLGVDFANSLEVPALPLPLYVASQFRGLLVHYLRYFVAPFGLSIAPPYVASSGALFDPLAWLGAGVLGATVWAIYRLRNNLLPAFGLSMFLLGFLPSALVVQAELTADRRFYISLAGLCLVAGWYLAKYAMHKGMVRKIGLIILFLVLSSLTIWRNFAWFSDLSLWQSTFKTNPQSSPVKAMLAGALLKAGRPDEAKKEAESALQLDSGNMVAHLIIGQIKLNGKLYREAEREFATALSFARKQHLSKRLLRQAEIGSATALVNLGQYSDARDRAMEVLINDRNDVEGNLIMGKSLIGLDQRKFALNFLNTGFKMDQSNVDYLEPIADASLGVGSLQFARNAYGAASTAMRIAPTDNLRRIFAQAALELGRYKESEDMIDSLLKQQPDNPQYLYIKSCIEKELGNAELAESLKKRALQKDPKIVERMQIKILERNKVQTQAATK